MNILLAPMEGVVDSYMREILTGIGGYRLCITEFVRITNQLLPAKVYRRLCPELDNGGRTRSGTPVVVQLLGGIPEVMAANARRAVELGALGIDINFGCPSNLVNRNAGGAVLLKEPQRLYDVVRAVRCAVPKTIPVSAKLRLGYDNTDLALDNGHAVQAAGADFVTVHARTKADGYKPPARWEWLARINEALTIPIIANGDINSVEAYIRCREISGCQNVMIGRGAVARPDLALQIKHYQQQLPLVPLGWQDVHALLVTMAASMKRHDHVEGRHIVARMKQWLVLSKRGYREAQGCFEALRGLTHYAEMEALLNSNRGLVSTAPIHNFYS